ncbi:hypothetical protein [Salinigranum marinum]|uniref:hypothetical protein n=1 Tax=Salinigranum marinum TaxID=1515595 RepID=UPI00298A0381|nr:hypothetical protein [Salinigranum marinum]
MNPDPRYREVQRFRQRWLWALLGGITLLTIVLGPTSPVGLAIVGAVAAFLFGLRLETEVRADGIYLKMWPLHLSFRRIPWSEIERYESRTYSPLREFGGWGIRWAPGKIAYNVSGNRGVWIQRSNDRSVLVGSQHAEDLVEAIEEVYES